jgi:hypothetical protein
MDAARIAAKAIKRVCCETKPKKRFPLLQAMLIKFIRFKLQQGHKQWGCQCQLTNGAAVSCARRKEGLGAMRRECLARKDRLIHCPRTTRRPGRNPEFFSGIRGFARERKVSLDQNRDSPS